MSICIRLLLAISFVCALQSDSQATIVYNEAINGELEGDSNAPTDLTVFMPGANTVTGQVIAIGMDGGNGTADVFTFEIAAGQQLDTIFLTAFATEVGQAMFLALDDGPTFQFTSEQINDQFTLPDLTQIMGAAVVGNAHVGTDILDDLENAVNFGLGSVFTTPLGPGQYSIYIQETGPLSLYSLSFNVSASTAVPEPSSMALCAIGMGLIFRPRRKCKLRT